MQPLAIAGCNLFTRLPPKTSQLSYNLTVYRRKVRRSFQFPEPLQISWHSKILRRPSNNGEPQTALKTLLKFHSPPNGSLLHSNCVRASLWSPSGISRFWQALMFVPKVPAFELLHKTLAAAGDESMPGGGNYLGRRFAEVCSCQQNSRGPPWPTA